jgi:magnesium transporter
LKIRGIFDINSGMIRISYLSRDGAIRDAKVEEIKMLLQDTKGIVWVDFEGEPDGTPSSILAEEFGFHPLSIEDALDQCHLPKLDDWTSYLYIVMHTLEYGRDKTEIINKELDIFLGKNFLVTMHEQKIEAIDRVRVNAYRDPKMLKRGADYLLYLICDLIIEDFLSVVEQFDETVEEFESEIIDNPTKDVLIKIFAYKRTLLGLRRYITHQREVFDKMSREPFSQIEERDRMYFRDLYDHLVRLYDITESMRDIVSGALDIYLSVVNNRMNDIMKTLTTIATIFMPISFLTGFFGMNFFSPSGRLDFWTDIIGFGIAFLIIVGTPVSMIFWMRRRGWM